MKSLQISSASQGIATGITASRALVLDCQKILVHKEMYSIERRCKSQCELSW